MRIILYSIFISLLFTKQSINAQSLWLSGEPGAEDIQFLHSNDQNTVIAGVFDQSMSGNQSLGSTDVYLLAIDSNEQQEWAIHIGSKGQDDVLDSEESVDGDLIFLVGCNGPSIIDQDTVIDQNISHQLLVKLDHLGTLNHRSSFYGNQWCDIQQVIEFNGNFLVFGAYFDSLFVNGSFVDYCDSIQTIMIRLDTTLQYMDHLIIQTGGQMTVKEIDADTSIVVLAEFTGFIRIGTDSFLANPIYSDLLVFELDQAGSVHNINHLSGVYQNQGATITIIDSLLILSGVFEGTIQVADSILATAVLKESGFLICMQRDGTPKWLRRISSNQQVFITHHLEHQDHLIVSGYFSGQLDSEQVNAQGGYDAFVASYRISDGEFVAAQRWGDSGNDRANRLGRLGSNHMAAIGSFQGMLSADYQSISAIGFSDGILAKLRPETVSVSQLQVYPNINIYPNPSSGLFYINSPENVDQWEVYNSAGLRVAEGSNSETFHLILPNGAYWIRIHCEDYLYVMPIQILSE